MFLIGWILILIGALVVLKFLQYLPIRRVVLMEGVFDRKEYSSDFYRELICFWFENYCRNCFEKNLTHKSSMCGQCYTVVPKNSFQLGKQEPKQGDSIKVTAWKTIFGRVIFHSFSKTNFDKETAQEQLRREKEEWKAYHEAFDRREAFQRGMTVQEYREVEEKEAIENAATVLNIVPDEVVKHEYHKIPRFNLDVVRNLRKELGREPTQDELTAAFAKDFKEVSERSLNTNYTPTTPEEKARER